MTNTVSAAATGLPSRRRALASLAGLGAALGFPKGAEATASLDAPDAVLIAHAAMVEQMAVRAYAALTRSCDLENEIDRLKPTASRPATPAPLHASKDSIEDLPDGSLVIRSTRVPIDPAAARAFKEQQAALEAWDADREAIRERVGKQAADDLYGDLFAALEDVVRDLSPMVPTTVAGLTAKARAAVALDPHGDNLFNNWEDELRSAVLRDVMSIDAGNGGAA